MNKKLSLVALTAVAALALTGCTSATNSLADKDGIIPLTTKVNVSKMPSWEKSSVSALDKNWTVTPIAANELQKNAKDFPSLFIATSKNGACTINYDLTMAPLQKLDDAEDYTTRDYIYNDIKIQGGTNNDEGTSNIAIANSSDKLELLQVGYTMPNKVVADTGAIISADQDPSTLVAAEPTISGNVNVVSLTRILTSPVNNPFYIANPQIDENDLPPGIVGKTGRPVISLKYSCVNEDLDMKLWDKVITAASLNMPIIKK